MEFSKVDRTLKIYDKLISGEVINKKKLAYEFNVNNRTIQRDIEDIRNYLSDSHETEKVLYDHKHNGYYLDGNNKSTLSTVEMFSIIKILLESRAFCKEEMQGIVNSIFSYVPKLESKSIKSLVLNELYHFQPVTHEKPMLKMIWDLGQCILRKEAIEIEFMKLNGENSKRAIYPLAIVFSEFYFYLVARIEDSKYNNPAFFRIDRIEKFKLLNKKYLLNRFEEGELKKRVMFMYGGDLMKIKFKYTGIYIEHILDRFPIAQVTNISKDVYEFEVEVYGKGCLMWFLSQGENVELISPESLRKELIEKINKMSKIYDK